MERLTELLNNYVEDRKRMNAMYGLYKDYSDRVKSWDSQLHNELDRLSKPLTKREKDYLKKIVDDSDINPEKEPF